ncbi:MAG: plasmid recombination protein [Oscillospiraceae bacterium]|nr:plasmid recombination protein [Oscillospiraceae bacterium]
MVGKGSVNHNTRKFHAHNTDPQRAHLNRSYCNDDIREVYQELFGAAVERYNAKQTRADRCISDYYEKIRSGKQEKPFHEIILQVGNRDDMNAQTDKGRLAERILDEYYQSFQSRNPNMRVFSVHLHMDEATPHIHIDFVPFTTGSSRGLDTRVSLKQALATQGFKGGSRQETEWNQWVQAEKEQIAQVMERHGIEWEQLGTHEKHLSVLDYTKKVRSEEVAQLEVKVEDLQGALESGKGRIKNLNEHRAKFEKLVHEYDTSPKWQLPEPQPLQSAKAYKSKIAPLFKALKAMVQKVLSHHKWALDRVASLEHQLDRAQNQLEPLKNQVLDLKKENYQLKQQSQKVQNRFNRIRKLLGKEAVDEILSRTQRRERTRGGHDLER